ELTSDLGVPLAISRALLTEDSVEQLMRIIEDSGLRDAFYNREAPERVVLPLARTLGDPRAWLWLARGVFHSSVVTLVPERIRDGDVTVRLAAVDALTNTPGDDAIEALYPALHDTSTEVQQAALKGLRLRCDDEGLRARLDGELSEITAIVERANSRHTFLHRIPGLSRLMSARRR
ncbi:MAG: HEAT repeat domain-containing protein, partial [Proteobacteria bacterium]|nr:HEAT repeat domain-containing protein [Pseudomonadota bacterium]